MIELAVFGAGRIGRVHALNIAHSDHARVKYIVDPNAEAANTLAAAVGARVADADTVFGDPDVAGVVIGSATGAHAEQLRAAVAAGKPAFCEKPLSLDFAETVAVADTVTGSGVPVMLGFQRRYDPDFRALRERIHDGTAGALEQVVMFTRDPAPPPVDYLRGSGGMVRDQAIHDLDMARYLLDEPVVTVSAFGSVLVDDAFARIGDIDTLQVTLISKSGRQVILANSRRSPLGYDERLDALCAREVLRVENKRRSQLTIADASGNREAPPENYFMERFAEAYRLEMEAFVALIREGAEPLAGIADGVEGQRLAEAAVLSLDTGRPVDVRTVEA